MASIIDDGDLPFQLASLLLGHLVQRVVNQGRQVQRAFVSGDVGPPEFDDPCKGVAWTRVASVVASGQATDIIAAGEDPAGHLFVIEAGIFRCKTSPVQPKGRPPTPEQLTGEALATSLDRDALMRAVECDFPGTIDDLDCDGYTYSPWLPISDYVGGWLTVTVTASITQ